VTPGGRNTATMYDQITFKFVGTSPLMMHSSRGALPLDPLVKQLKTYTAIPTKKRTDETYETIYRLEWEIGLYYDAELGPCIPTANLRSSIVSGAKRSRLGTDVKRATLITEEMAKLEYVGPRTIPELYAAKIFTDTRIVKNPASDALLERTRPVFKPPWSVTFEMHFDPSVLQKEKLIEAAEVAGRYEGVGDYRPPQGGQFGRFNVEVL